nr:hypothetical protein [Clostridia bacterium]
MYGSYVLVVALGTCYEGIYGCFSYDSGSSFSKPKLEVNNLILILTQLFIGKTDISTVKKDFFVNKRKEPLRPFGMHYSVI